MTAQRLVRGSKSRIIAILCGVVFCVGLLVLLQNNQTRLDNISKNYEICVQQQESLSTQLQVIVDYKTRLEKSLQSEKNEHKQTRTELESRINDEKSRRDKTSMEATMRFQSLQQHYNLLQTKHDDLKEKSDKLQAQFLEETDKLQSKVKEIQEQLKRSENNRERSLEHLKTKYMVLENEKHRLEEQLKKSLSDHTKWESDLNHLTKENIQLQRELEEIKHQQSNHEIKRRDDNPKPNEEEETLQRIQPTNIIFSKQVEVASDVYQIRDKDDKPTEDKENNQQVDAPNINNENNNNNDNNDNNNNNNNNVLQKPSNLSKSTPKTKTSSAANVRLDNARPLLLPTMTPSTKNVTKKSMDSNFNANNILPIHNEVPHKKIPAGVVPVPIQELQKNEESQAKNEKTEDKNAIPEEINLALPNRYRNNIIENELANEIKETKVDAKPFIQNEPEVNMDQNPDNAAMEVVDHPRNPVQEDPLHLMDVNQGFDTNDVKMQELEAIKDPVVQLVEGRKFKKQHIDVLRGGENGALRAPPGGGGGGLYEGEGDYDKEGQKGDIQIEEAEPEEGEDDDGDDYDGHLAARQKDPAVRN